MKKQLLLVAIALLTFGVVNAQDYYYFPAKGTTAEYSMNQAGATIITNSPASNNLSAEVNLPFAFNFYGQAVTKFKASTSGYITFDGTQTTSVNVNTALNDPSAPNNSIFAFWDNTKLEAITQNGNTFLSDIRTWTYGTAPKRVCVIQWRLVQAGATAATNVTYYAIRLYEGGDFDIVHNYGFGTFTASAGVRNSDGTLSTSIAGTPSMNFGGANGSYTPAQSDVYIFRPGPQPANDVALLSLNLPKYEKTNNNIYVKGTVFNFGKDNLSSFRVNYSVNNGPAVSMTLSGLNINKFATYDFSHPIPYSATVTTNADIKVWISLPNNSADADSSNNNATGSFYAGEKTTPRRVLHEVFTSSTCPPCRPGNIKLNEVLNSKVGDFAVVKYQYYFPGIGDPYFTQEGLNRGTYYGGVSSVPNMMVDGAWKNNPNSYTPEIFDGFKQVPSYTELTCKLTMTGNKADVIVDVKPLNQMPVGTYKLYIALVEKNTVQNVKTNGETNFEFVMKKMLPNDAGQAFTFPAANQSKSVTASFTFPGQYRLAPSASFNANLAPTGTNYAGIDITKEHSVEKFYDLHAVAFIIRQETKDVMQAAWTAQDWAMGNNETSLNANEFKVYPNPTNNFFTIDWNGKGKASFRVLDLNGKEVISQETIGNINTEIPCGYLTPGVYFVEMNIDGQTTVKKLSIIR